MYHLLEGNAALSELTRFGAYLGSVECVGAVFVGGLCLFGAYVLRSASRRKAEQEVG